MPRALTRLFLGVVVGLTASVLPALDPGIPEPRWTIQAPATVLPGVPFEVTARVELPPGYYQDAESAFLVFEPASPAVVSARSSSPPTLRDGKASFAKSFTLHRTVTVAAGTPGGRLDLSFTLGWQICQVDGVCLLPAQRTAVSTVTVAGPDAGSLVWAFLAAAFVGGLLLNAMPCVFPVLVLKVVALGAAGSSPQDRRREALAFAAGSWATITALGLVTAGAAALGQRLDWGFSFQSPWFVGALALVFWAWALPLAGVLTWSWSPFRFTAPVPGVSRPGRSWFRSFGGGAVVVLAAAPCTAPLLGPALGFAFSQPPAWIPVFFGVAGLGLALPVAVLALIPAWTRFVPRPGRWLVVVERAAGVALGATVVYLVWIGSRLTHDEWFVPGLIVLGLITGALAVGRRPERWAPTVRVALALGALAVGGSSLVAGTRAPDPRLPPGWQAFSTEALAQARAQGKTVFVDATADWCATCQVNEVAVLLRPDVAQRFESRGIVRMRADYTRPSADIRGWLGSVGRAGLPVYALYQPDRPPLLFPELLTDDNFTRVLDQQVSLTPEKGLP